MNRAYGPMRDDIVTRKACPSYAATPPRFQGGNSPTSTAELAAKYHHVGVTDHKATVHKRIEDLLFDYLAGSFLQNNNDVLVPLTSYVRDAIFPSTSASSSPPPNHLVDAFCGAGLFALTPAPHLRQVAGIGLFADTIRFATQRASTASRSSSHPVLATRGVDLQRLWRISSLTILLRVCA
ncbi:hypothetical protein BC826DRAFT_1106278 [Russula brevipes]|nr:hypothetical protein BC826DRAFT_1106278 [Russula brevipes]